MGILPMAVVLHGIGRYSGQKSKSASIFFASPGKERFALADSIGVPTEIAEYREHGQDAHATKMRLGIT